MDFEELSDRDKWKKLSWGRFASKQKKQVGSFNPQVLGGFDELSQVGKLVEKRDLLSNRDRLDVELNTFNPEGRSEDPYEYLIIKYGVMAKLIRQHDCSLPQDELISHVQEWESDLHNASVSYEDDDLLLNLARAASDYGGEDQEVLSDRELNLIQKAIEHHNANMPSRERFEWIDFFKRMSAINNFPYVAKGHESHGEDKIKKRIFTLNYQALLYRVKVDGDWIIGIPEEKEYIKSVKDWMNYELRQEDYRSLLEIDELNRQDVLIEIADTFGLEKKQGNENRIKIISSSRVLPSEVLNSIFSDDKLRSIASGFDLDWGRTKDSKIKAIINHFDSGEGRIPSIDDGESEGVAPYLAYYEDMAVADVSKLSTVRAFKEKISGPQAKPSEARRLFEEATARIFQDIFNLDVQWRGDKEGGAVPDGEINWGNGKILWDNKTAESGTYSLDRQDQRQIVDYAEHVSKNHKVYSFVLITPGYREKDLVKITDIKNKTPREVDLDVCLVTANDILELAEFWLSERKHDELPMRKTFNDHCRFKLDHVLASL